MISVNAKCAPMTTPVLTSGSSSPKKPPRCLNPWTFFTHEFLLILVHLKMVTIQSAFSVSVTNLQKKTQLQKCTLFIRKPYFFVSKLDFKVLVKTWYILDSWPLIFIRTPMKSVKVLIMESIAVRTSRTWNSSQTRHFCMIPIYGANEPNPRHFCMIPI